MFTEGKVLSNTKIQSWWPLGETWDRGGIKTMHWSWHAEEWYKAHLTTLHEFAPNTEKMQRRQGWMKTVKGHKKVHQVESALEGAFETSLNEQLNL